MTGLSPQTPSRLPTETQSLVGMEGGGGHPQLTGRSDSCSPALRGFSGPSGLASSPLAAGLCPGSPGFPT